VKKLLAVFTVFLSFSLISAEEENLFGDTSEGDFDSTSYEEESASQPVTNEDRTEENIGKETNAEPVKKEKAKGGNKFQQFVHRSPNKKALAGIKFGPEIYHMNYTKKNSLLNDHVDYGFHTDLFFEYNFIKNFGLQAELNFGGGYFGFFRLPIIAQFNLPINDMFWLNFGLGPYLAAGYWNGFDLGLIAKVALEINTKVGVFVADIRYTSSLYGLKYDWYFGSFAILVGYAVPLPF